MSAIAANINWYVTIHRGEVPFTRTWKIFPPFMVLVDKLHRTGEVGTLFVLYENEEDRDPVEMFMLDFLVKTERWNIKIGDVRPPEVVDMGKEVAGHGTVFAKIVEETAHDSIPPAVLFFGARGRQLEGQHKLLQVLHGVRILWFDKQQSIYFKREHKHEYMVQFFVREFNEKIGGANFEVDLTRLCGADNFHSNLLVIGYSVAHPRDKMAQPIPEKMRDEFPSVVAFSANSTEPNTFLGDFDFQPAWQEQISPKILIRRMKRILEQRRTSAGSLPDQIVLIRDGFPDQGASGDYSKLLTEVLTLKRACAEFQTGYFPNFSVIRVATELENHHVFEDLYYDDDNLSDKVHALMKKLSFKNQVTGLPVSNPEPMHVAFFTARQGGMIFATHKDYGYALPRVNQSDTVDWETLSEVLSPTM